MLELKNIKKVYKTKDSFWKALKDVNVSFREREFVSILGPSGAGKTTLLNIIGGLDSYNNGDLIVNGKSTKHYNEVDWDSYRNFHIGFIFQNYNLINHISVYQNVEMALTLSNVKNKKNKVINILRKLDLEKYMNKKPNELSGGQMQRVAIARALVNEPDIILADEPSGALDSKTSIEIMEIIKKISKDKLVIMVTHNEELAKKYSTRIIKIKDGCIISDSNPLYTIKRSKELKLKKTKMNYKTALRLSINNLKSKKGRTILTSFASSIGIIGIALILSISNGFKNQIDDYEKDILSSFPLTISSITQKPVEIDNNIKSYSKEKVLYINDYNTNNEAYENKISDEFLNYIKNINKKYVSLISYDRITNFNLLINDNDKYRSVNNEALNLTELPMDDNFLKENYDLLTGNFPKEKTELVLIVNDKNMVSKNFLEALSIDVTKKKVDFSSLMKKEFKLVRNEVYYKEVQKDTFVINDINKALYENNNNKTLKIVGIIRGKKDSNLVSIINGMDKDSDIKLGYSNDLLEEIIKENKDSKIVKVQKELGSEEALLSLGAKSTPVMINIYPKDFEGKEKIIKYLNKYNENKPKKEKIMYIDYAKEMVNLTKNIMNGITLVLVFFSSISLIVSSVMVGIITYISVLERTKEIGILRSLGARKKDIIRVFNAETLTIGLLSGLIGIIITKILLLPINSILYKLTELKNIGVLDPKHAIILITISIILTLISGLIPSVKASRKNAVEALRSE